MKKTFYLLAALVLSSAPWTGAAQSTFTLKTEVPANADNEPAPVFPVPSARQLKWNETEFYAFFHYGMNTYTNKEWGKGDELETTFNPTAAPNPEQWLTACKAAGMKGGIAVVKHHDGFCLWPTKTTTHNVTNSAVPYGKTTNIPRDFAAAAQKLGMKYGFYVSPWDRNSKYWGEEGYADSVFFPQCAELAQYGTDQFEMWFDGATGGGGYYGGSSNTDRSISNATTYYDIPNLRDSIHKICPEIILWGEGGEARWIGNEAGWAGQTNWSNVNKGGSQNSAMYGDEEGWYWEAGESDAKATDKGWFWHSGETPLTAERLFQMYLETVGRNATLILNCPPDKSGSLPDATVSRLEELGQLMTTRFGTDLAKTAKIEASEVRTAGTSRTYVASNMNDDNKDTYWATNDGTKTATITLTWDETQNIHYVSLMEYIKLGQRIKGFKIETTEDGATWTERARGVEKTTVGYKRIIPLNGSTSSSYGNGYNVKGVRITITDAKACPTLHTVQVY